MALTSGPCAGNRRHCRIRGALAACATGLLPATASLAQSPPNDLCQNATPIAGAGLFPFDLTSALYEGTISPTAQQQCFDDPVPGFEPLRSDVFFCWTSPVTGMVTIQTCGQTQVDTRLLFWQECACPDPAVDLPFCCADDSCGLQSAIFCEVVCGKSYLIQVGCSPFGAPGPGNILVTLQGTPCDAPSEPCEEIAGQCCTGRPDFEDPVFQAFHPGAVAVVTASPGVLGGQVLTVFEVGDTSSATSGSNYPAPLYSHPSWTATSLGSIFGIAIDPDGNIYVTPTRVYLVDTPGPHGWGHVRKVDRVTGSVTAFTTSALPNTGTGLGNISYDCDHEQFFVTNMEDGIIYRIDMAGAVLSTWDHGAADDGSAGFAPLGERVWGLAVHDNRLYYAVWWEDGGNPDPSRVNEIWSLPLLGGDFGTGAQLEIQLPPLVDVVNSITLDYSNPVATIRFTPQGHMLLAERSMNGPDSSGAHESRLLEYVCENGVWVPGNHFGIGVNGFLTGDSSCAGGVDVDFEPSAGLVWSTGDALQFNPDVIYGLQGLPAGGGVVGGSVLIDYQGNLDVQDKTSIGAVAVSCPRPCAVAEIKEIECDLGRTGQPTGTYSVTISVTNFSGQPAQYGLIPDLAVSPNVLVFIPPIPGDGSVTETVTLTVTGDPGERCFDIIFATATFIECCRIQVCPDLPDCECMVFSDPQVFCDPTVAGAYNLFFTWTNTSSFVADHLFVIPAPPNAPWSITPQYINIPPTPPGSSLPVGPFVIVGAAPGTEICVLVTIHDPPLVDCCAREICVSLPQCSIPDPCDPAMDPSGDGLWNFDDLLLVLSAWGPCPGTPCVGDLDCDGDVDFDDLLMLLSRWS